jgi:hypothetical protein
MLSRLSPSAWFLLSASVLALGTGCKDRDSAGQDLRPLPTPEPPASASPSLARDDVAAPKKRALDDDAKESGKAKRPAPDASAAKVPGSAPSPAVGTGGAATTASGGGTAAVAVPSAPPFAAPSAACLSRCQGAMQGCLSAPVDGGVPGFSNLDLCKKAFEACQSACAQQ